MKEGNENPVSVAKRSLQQLLESEDSPEMDKASAEINDAKKILATWVTRPFNIIQDYIQIQIFYENVVVLSRAYPEWGKLLTLASNNIKGFRDTLHSYHYSIDMAPRVESSLLRYDQSVQIKAEAIVAGKKYAEDFELAQMDITRLEQKLELARARKDEALPKMNEHLDKSKAADTNVRSLKNRLPIFSVVIHRPSFLHKMIADQHEGCVTNLKDLIRF